MFYMCKKEKSLNFPAIKRQEVINYPTKAQAEVEEENQHFQSWVGADAVAFEGLRNHSKIDL